METADQYDFLDDREENELHKSRLLNVEEKPFKRILKQMNRLITPNIQKLPTPPPDATTESQDGTSSLSSASDPTCLKEDITLDFAAFDAVIARLQFLATANAAERKRYQKDRTRILQTMDSVRENNTMLRTQLEEAKATLAQRKKFDDLADKITSNRMLRTRAEQEVNLAKLAEECEELQRESETYGVTWRERKEQFDKLVDEGVNLRKLIRDEKEEVERREGMDEDGDEDAGTPGKTGSQSGNATPRPGSSSGRTPRPESPGANGSGQGDSLKPRPDAAGAFSRGGSLAPSVPTGSPMPDSQRAGSQAPKDDEPEEGEDVEMGESTQAIDTPMAEVSTEDMPQITVDAPATTEDKMDTT